MADIPLPCAFEESLLPRAANLWNQLLTVVISRSFKKTTYSHLKDGNAFASSLLLQISTGTKGNQSTMLLSAQLNPGRLHRLT